MFSLVDLQLSVLQMASKIGGKRIGNTCTSKIVLQIVRSAGKPSLVNTYPKNRFVQKGSKRSPSCSLLNQ